jgi:tripartite ATP-independent transporter DctM subunit
VNPLLVGLIGIVVWFVLFFLRVPIAFAFGIVGFGGLWCLKGLGPALSALGTVPFSSMNNYAWTVIPLFVFMGYLSLHTKLAEEFYSGVYKWVGSFRGGMATAIIAGNSAFGAVSGDSLSAAVAFTTISLPEARKYKYADSLTLGSITAGSLLAQLIPPSMGFIMFGVITQTDIAELFIAGVFPGLILAVLFVITIYLLCKFNPKLAPVGPRTTWKEKLRAGMGMWALIVVFVILIGGLYLGLFTPTEGGAAAAFVVFLIGLARRKLSWQGFKTALIDSGIVTGMTAFLLISAMLFNLFLVMTGLPSEAGELITGITASPIGILFIIVAIYFVLGTAIDALALMLLTLPMFFPVIVDAGIDPVQFGVITSVVMGIAQLSPPDGLVVYAVSQVSKVPLFTVFKAVYPFFGAYFVLTFLTIFFPQISVFLPNLMRGG